MDGSGPSLVCVVPTCPPVLLLSASQRSTDTCRPNEGRESGSLVDELQGDEEELMEDMPRVFIESLGLEVSASQGYGSSCSRKVRWVQGRSWIASLHPESSHSRNKTC